MLLASVLSSGVVHLFDGSRPRCLMCAPLAATEWQADRALDATVWHENRYMRSCQEMSCHSTPTSGTTIAHSVTASGTTEPRKAGVSQDASSWRPGWGEGACGLRAGPAPQPEKAPLACLLKETAQRALLDRSSRLTPIALSHGIECRQEETGRISRPAAESAQAALGVLSWLSKSASLRLVGTWTCGKDVTARFASKRSVAYA